MQHAASVGGATRLDMQAGTESWRDWDREIEEILSALATIALVVIYICEAAKKTRDEKQ